MNFARFVVLLIRLRFAVHGCPDAFADDPMEFMAHVIAENTCHAARDYLCVAFAATPAQCGMHWTDKCTLTKPGPSPVCP